jgi:predicted RNase H-like HicB family nuclease
MDPMPASVIPPASLRIDALGTLATAASTQTPPKPSRMERIELAIDSLQNYELIEQIPVLIESLGDKVFVAEAPDLNVSTTGNSVGAAFLLLKEQILTTYEGYRSKKGPDSDRARQLAVFDKYIGKPRRHWF